MVDLKLKEGVKSTVINKDATLADGVRAAGDYDNSTNLHPLCDVYLTVQYDTAPPPPAEGDIVAELWVLYGDGEASEVFPQGGDGTVGNDDDPAGEHFVGAMECRAPSNTVNEILALKDVPLSHATNRFVLKNVSGNTYDATWQVDIKTKLMQN